MAKTKTKTDNRNKSVKAKGNSRDIEETFSCDSKERAKNTQEYEAMLMQFILGDMGV